MDAVIKDFLDQTAAIPLHQNFNVNGPIDDGTASIANTFQADTYLNSN